MAYDPRFIAPLRIRTEEELDRIVEEELGGYEQLGDLYAGFQDAERETLIGDDDDDDDEDDPQPPPPPPPPPPDPEDEDTPNRVPTPTGGDGDPRDLAALREMLLDSELPGEGGENPFGFGGDQGFPQGAEGVPMPPEDQPVPKPADFRFGGIGIIPGPYHGNPPQEVDVGIQTPGRLPTVPGFTPPTTDISYALTPSGFSSIAARSARQAIVNDLKGQQDRFLGATSQFGRDIVGGMRTSYGPTSRMQELQELQLRPPQGIWANRTLTDAGGGGGPDH